MAPEVEGVAQVVEWRQVGEYAAVTDLVWLRRMNLVLDGPKKAGKGMCMPMSPRVKTAQYNLL